MRTSTILLSVALVFKTVYSKAVGFGNKIKDIQQNVVVNDEYEIVNGNNFTYKLHCPEEKQFCDKIKSDLDYAFNAISDTLEFYQPIVFEAFVDDLTGKYKIDALGGLTDPNYVALKSSNDSSSTPVLYPQSLVKQLNLNKEPEYKRNDFVLILNNMNKASSPNEQGNELRHILIHELLHGLGFMSTNGIGKLDDTEANDISNPIIYKEEDKYLILPYNIINFDDKLSEIMNLEEYNTELYSSEYSKFIPLSIFDKNLVSIETGENLLDNLQLFHEELNEKCLPEDGSPILLKDFTNKFLKNCFEKLSPETQQNVTHLFKYYFIKSNSVGFLTKDGDILPLQTLEGIYCPGSSISHPANSIQEGYYTAKFMKNDTSEFNDFFIPNTNKFSQETLTKYYDGNFILYIGDRDDLTAEEMLKILAKDNKHGLIGDGIVNVLKTLGWTEKGEKRSDEIYYVDESINLPEENSFLYTYIKPYNLRHNKANNFIVNDVEAPLQTDSVNSDTEIDVDVNDTTTPNDESDFDSDIEEQQQ